MTKRQSILRAKEAYRARKDLAAMLKLLRSARAVTIFRVRGA